MFFKATIFALPLLVYASALPGTDIASEKRDTTYPTMYTENDYQGYMLTIPIDTQKQCCGYIL